MTVSDQEWSLIDYEERRIRNWIAVRASDNSAAMIAAVMADVNRTYHHGNCEPGAQTQKKKPIHVAMNSRMNDRLNTDR